MKFNKRNPKHLFLLASTLIFILIAIIASWFPKRKTVSRKSVIFYGHTLNGNLKAFYDHLDRQDDYEVHFLSFDKKYLRKLESMGQSANNLLYALNLKDMLRVGVCDAIITSHGLHFFSLIRRFTSIKFIDVWHGIPYKGFDNSDLAHLHKHTQTWVSSKSMKHMYINKFGFPERLVKITGYGRVDQLIDGSMSREAIIDKYSLPLSKKYVLIAPTWKQDDKGRSVLPFGMNERKFFTKIDQIAKKRGLHIIFRSHLNTTDSVELENLGSTSFMPYAEYEIAEDFLFIADILVTDWSSIAFDYLPLDRPTIFLDVPPPFKKGFSLGPEYRFGYIVDRFEMLIEGIEKYTSSPNSYLQVHKKQIAHAKQAAYGATLDGRSCERYEKELHEILK